MKQPRFRIMPHNEEDKETTKVMEKFLNWEMDKNRCITTLKDGKKLRCANCKEIINPKSMKSKIKHLNCEKTN